MKLPKLTDKLWNLLAPMDAWYVFLPLWIVFTILWCYFLQQLMEALGSWP